MFPTNNNGNDFAAPSHDATQSLFGSSTPCDMDVGAEVFDGFARAGHHLFPDSVAYEAALYADTPSYMLNSRGSPLMYADDGPDMRMPSSSLSTASAASSAIGSPQSNPGQAGAYPEHAAHTLLQPVIVAGNDFISGSTEYSSFAGPGMEDLASFDFPAQTKGFVGELPAASPPRVPHSVTYHILPPLSSVDPSARFTVTRRCLSILCSLPIPRCVCLFGLAEPSPGSGAFRAQSRCLLTRGVLCAVAVARPRAEPVRAGETETTPHHPCREPLSSLMSRGEGRTLCIVHCLCPRLPLSHTVKKCLLSSSSSRRSMLL